MEDPERNIGKNRLFKINLHNDNQMGRDWRFPAH